MHTLSELCTRKHRYSKVFNNLPLAQDNQNDNRHVCAGCAYIEGLKDALNDKGKRNSLKGLPISQAGVVRHKDAWKSYNQAYDFGKKLKL